MLRDFVTLPERGSEGAVVGRAEVYRGSARQPKEGLAGAEDKQRRIRPDSRAEGDGSMDRC